MSKGSRNRVSDFAAYRNNHDRIFGGDMMDQTQRLIEESKAFDKGHEDAHELRKARPDQFPDHRLAYLEGYQEAYDEMDR